MSVSFCARDETGMAASRDDDNDSVKTPKVDAPHRLRRKKSSLELWAEVHNEVETILDRSMRRLEYIEWSRQRIFLTVLRRHHPLLSLFIHNPVLTAVQRCLIGGAVLLGLLMVTAALFNYDTNEVDSDSYEDVSNKHPDDCLLNCGGELGDWEITARQLAVFFWAMIIAKPVPFCIYLLFRKDVPVIAPATVKRRRDSTSSLTSSMAHPQAPAPNSLSSLFQPFYAASEHTHRENLKHMKSSTIRGISKIGATGRHSGIFPLEMKLDRLEKWHRKERLGFLLAFLWWTWCIYFALTFVLSPRLADMAEWPIYRDFVVTALIDLIGHLLLQPLINFFIVTCLIGSVTKTGLLDGFVAAFPRYLDFTFSGTRSVQELAVQLHVIRDANIGRRAVLDAEWAQDEGLKIALTAVKLLCHGHPIIVEERHSPVNDLLDISAESQRDENALESAKEAPEAYISQ
ncbi:unnamed protein product [Vitrella brassicaformis CCMP3155]|uniref:Uncharacterized protein n=1 Tax=Vitrella brassicaformis (strain CCMP3155) TaxID=1169540 RepID=A0A0G4FLG2_VITBC|nr:unnamed protein product [Vitrella brassicaformis CCMP3155]|eukprot:CEM14849.1 unnamed protein product [Vitrella brassicaformis CCMP3155]